MGDITLLKFNLQSRSARIFSLKRTCSFCTASFLFKQHHLVTIIWCNYPKFFHQDTLSSVLKRHNYFFCQSTIHQSIPILIYQRPYYKKCSEIQTLLYFPHETKLMLLPLQYYFFKMKYPNFPNDNRYLSDVCQKD